jgi:mycothiol synthase
MTTGISSRPLRPEEQVQQLAELFNAAERAIGGDDWIVHDELHHELTYPGLDHARDTSLWEDEEGLLAYAYLHFRQGAEPDAFLRFRARPDAGGREVEPAIFDWAAARVAEARQERGIAYSFRCGAQSYDTARIALIEGQGFRPTRYFQRLSCPLDEQLAQPAFPAGYRLRNFAGEADLEPWAEMFNQSFVDHWNHEDLTPERLRYYLSEPGYRPDLDLIAIAADGTFAGFCTCALETAAQTGKDYDLGFIQVLGVRRGHRSLGLGRALLLAGMQRLREEGATVAALNVDAANPSGAGRLYAAVGFQLERAFILFSQEG